MIFRSSLSRYFGSAAACLSLSLSLTLFLHVDSETLFEPARLALVPPGHVHDAVAALLAHVVQVPVI